MEIARKIIAGTFIALTFIPLALINMLHVPAGVAPDWMKGPVWLFMWWLMFMMALGLVAFVLEATERKTKDDGDIAAKKSASRLKPRLSLAHIGKIDVKDVKGLSHPR